MSIAPLALAFVLLSQSAAAEPEFLLSTGQQAPPFSMRDLDKKIFSVADHVGKTPTARRKAVFLSFFATWCKPCIKEIPIVRRLHGVWQPKGIEFTYVGQSQSARELKPFAGQHKMPGRVIPDTFGLLSRRYGATRLPHLVLIDEQGKIAFQHTGVSDNLEQILAAEMARLTGEKVPTPVVRIRRAPRITTSMSMGRPPSMKGSAARWQPLANYVGENIGSQIEVSSADSYESFEQELLRGKYDLVNAGPLLCSRAKKHYVPLVSVERQGTPTYLGLVFAKRSAGLSSITDLRGKSIALVSANSTSGGLYVLKALIDAGLKPGRDVKILWAGTHAAVAEAVRDDKADAGGCFEDCRDLAWSSRRDKVKQTRILAYTEEIPAEMILVRRSLKGAVRTALRDAMLGASESTTLLRQISEGELSITALTEASDHNLRPIVKVVKQVRAASR